MSQARNEPETAEVDRLLTAAARVIAGVRYCWLVSEAGTGGLNARPMGHLAAPNHEWNIRFVTDGRSRKASEMRRAGKVAVHGSARRFEGPPPARHPRPLTDARRLVVICAP